MNKGYFLPLLTTTLEIVVSKVPTYNDIFTCLIIHNIR